MSVPYTCTVPSIRGFNMTRERFLMRMRTRRSRLFNVLWHYLDEKGVEYVMNGGVDMEMNVQRYADGEIQLVLDDVPQKLYREVIAPALTALGEAYSHDVTAERFAPGHNKYLWTFTPSLTTKEELRNG
jgi:hypothetical protein